MSTNKKFRIQNGADIVGELSINDVTVIGADGKVVEGAIQDAVASLTAADIAALQSQVSAIIGTSPETLDTLQEIVAAFEAADVNLVSSVTTNTSDIATINTTLTNGVATPTDVADLQSQLTSNDTDIAANAAAIAAANARTSGISTSSGSSIQMNAEVDMGSNKVTNMADPSSAQDAATKAYVDAASSGSTSSLAAETAARIAGDAANSAEVTAAIATASADATAKADSAEADAKAYADQVVAATVDAAPAALDTLNELAAALGDDANFASTVTASIATKANDAATTAALATKADDAATTAALATKATAAQGALADTAIQAEDFGSGISTVSSSVVDWSSLTSADFAAISDTDEIYTIDRSVGAVDATDTHFVTLLSNQTTDNTSDSYREQVINVHLLDGTLVKSFQATEDYPELDYSWLSHLSVNGNYISFTRHTAVNNDTGSYGKIYDIRNIAQADHGLVKTIDEDNLRRLFTIDDTRAIAVYGSSYNLIDTVKVHNISDWSELYSFDPVGGYGTPDEADFGGGYFVTGGVSGNTNQGITILSTSGSYGLTGIVHNEYMHGPTNNTAKFANGITVNDKYVVFRTQETDGTNRAHVHSPVDGSYIRSFVEDSNTPWQVLNNTKGLGKAALALSGDVLFVPLGDYNSSTQQLKKGLAIYDILTGELLSEVTVFDGQRYSSAGASAENLYNVYTVGGSTIIDINEEMVDAGSISPLIATAPTSSITSFVVDTSLFATKDYVDPAINELQTNLQTQITAEVARASSAEAVNAANIVSETSARSSADAALESDIIGLQNQVGTIISGSPASLDTLVEIVSAFETADASLSGVITANSGRLTAAENNLTALDADIVSEASARSSADATLQANIDAEANTRSNLGSQLLGYININGGAITAEETARIAADATLQSNIGAEASARASAISAEASTRGSADTALQSAIDAEEAARIAADSVLQSNIDAEVTRATGVEAGLQSAIDFVKQNTDPAALDSLTEIVAAFQNADSSISGVVSSNTSRISSLETGQTAILAWDTDNVSEGTTNKYWTPERTKTALTGGLCITYNSSTGEIKIDEAETASSLHVASSTDANGLGGQAPSHYRIDVYDVNGTIVN